MSYTVEFADKNKSPISIDEEQIDTSTDITLFGRRRIAYGQELQENLLHILENFACPESSANPGNPDVNASYNNLLAVPTQGQFWYNSTKKLLNYFDGEHWVPLAQEDDLAANWGIIAHGQFLPKPVNELTGRVFDYDECVYIVSPFSIPKTIDYMICNANDSGYVTSQYRIKGSTS